MEVLSLDSLPLGFRFRPTDEELVHYYLRLKINGKNDEVRVIREIDVCKWEPWDLPDLSAIKTNDKEWFFFCPLDRKYPNGSRLNRATEAGYWKATGKDRRIKSGNNLIGMKKTLVFYTGRAPRGIRTSWVMHEYHPTEEELQGTLPGQCAFVLCKLFNKQDENNEGAKSGDIEPVFSSPLMVKSSPVNTPSELEYPESSHVSEREARKLAEDPQAVVAADIHCRIGDPCNVEDLVTEILGPEEDPQLGHDLEWLGYQSLGPLDCKVFSPLHSQMQVEIGTSSMFYSLNSELSNNNSGGMEFQYGINYSGSIIPEFFDSILGNPQPYPFGETPDLKNSAVKSETQNSMATIKELELPEKKGAMNELPCNNQESTLEGESSGKTGIRIRSRQPPSHNSKHNLELQGDAPRRLRLQSELRRYSINTERLQVKADDYKDKEASETGNREDVFAVKKRTKSISGDLRFRLKNIGSAPSAYGIIWPHHAVLIRIAVAAIILLISICSCKYLQVLN